MTSTVRAPFRSEIHLLLLRASAIVLPLPPAVTIPNKFGRICSKLCPAIHLSVQKRVFLPFPTTVTTAAAKKALTGRKAQAFPGSVFCNQSYLILRAQPKNWKWEMPNPPRKHGLVTLGHAIRQWHPITSLLPLQRKPLLILSMATRQIWTANTYAGCAQCPRCSDTVWLALVWNLCIGFTYVFSNLVRDLNYIYPMEKELSRRLCLIDIKETMHSILWILVYGDRWG